MFVYQYEYTSGCGSAQNTIQKRTSASKTQQV